MSKSSRKGASNTQGVAAKPALKVGSGVLPQTSDFRAELQERKFWERADSTPHVDWAKAELVRLPHLEPTSRSISLD